jgi:hypothetical protein
VCGVLLHSGFNFNSNTEAKKALDMVIKTAGYLPTHFVILAADVDNAYACEDPNSSNRYILFNPAWIRGLTTDTSIDADWVRLGILAHEVGHHALNHYIRGDTGSKPQLELEADSFAGSVLARFGATKGQAQSAFKLPEMCTVEGGESHPKCADRLAAVAKGWIQINDRRKPGTPIPAHPHIVACAEKGKWCAEPGYTLVSVNGDDLKARWQPGQKHSTAAHVTACTKEQMWCADAGYGFVNPGVAGDYRVSWQPGWKHPTALHVTACNEEGMWCADAGYVFVNPSVAGDYKVSWQPGRKHPTAANVVASQNEGSWAPAEGYTFVTNDRNNLTVRWQPGKKHSTAARVTACTKEQVWCADAGYVFVNPNVAGDFRVSWQPGRKHLTAPHVIASVNEGSWHPEAGYEWSSSSDNDLTVRWRPGKPIPSYPHVVACEQEGLWCPETGYVWTNPQNPSQSNYAVKPASP